MEESEKTQKFHKETKKKKNQQDEQNQSSQSRSPINNLEMSSRSSLHSLPQTTIESPLPDSPTLSSIPDSHGSSPHTIIPTPSVVSKTETPFRVTNGDFVEEEKKVSESRRQLRPPSFSSTPRESKWASFIRKALLGFRVTAFVSCLVSFSVMVSDRDKGWARDSFYNYKEFRFCLAANVIGFVYSGFMICDLVYLLSTSIRRSRHNLRHFLEFGLDQMLAYLLASASTSASIRVDDWQSNWGADKFPDLARASVSLSYVSFVAFAFCSLASGYALCALRSI
ncbi:Casparian strip membrane protein domain [Arabidopsis thaliana x Arabidopsis arenosa]|uniref:CASP-like protein n=1 Tax=Arabidopsis thaliana x Arabidopsis arenosa TaxID=1240361 RepID=A0A8T1YDE3_9BRAS|nr:Casparian strip membrane protein domain [Arabidopsis thaliana x Arabidopsis arenosa]